MGVGPVNASVSTNGTVSAGISIGLHEPGANNFGGVGAGVSYNPQTGLSVNVGLSMGRGAVGTGLTLSSQGARGSAHAFGNDLTGSKASANSNDWTQKQFNIFIPVWNTGLTLNFSNYEYYLRKPKTETAFGMLYYHLGNPASGASRPVYDNSYSL